MPVDPTIALKVTGGASGPQDSGYSAGAGAGNPFGFAGTLAETQKKLNDVKQFGATFAARQKFGQIMANSPDIPSAIEKAMQDPSVAAFVPDLVQTLAATQSSMQSYRGQVQAQTADALTHAMGALPGLAVDPAGAKSAMSGWINAIPDPGIRATVSKSMGNIQTALDDPSLDSAGRMKAITGAAVGVPGVAEVMNKFYGSSDQIDRGGSIQPGIRSSNIPSIINPNPGSFTASGNALTKTLPPQQGNTGAPLIGGAYGTGSSSGPGAGPGTVTGGINYSTQAADGTPLFDKSVDMLSPAIGRGTGAGGGNVMSDDQKHQSAALSDRFNKEDYNAYQGAVKSLGMLDEMGRNFDELARIDPGQKGNFLTSGAGGELRLSLAKTANAVSGVLGGDTVFDPSKIAAGEDLQKVTQRLGPSVLQSLLGQQREAAETILNMNEKGVPNINNTYLGGKLMISAIKQATQREVDLRNWKEAWLADPRNQGSLIGADKIFNDMHPASGYINKALDEYGLKAQGGFRDLTALESMVKKGLMTPKQAAEQAKLQGFKLGQ